MIPEDERIKYTEDFLKLIAYRLAGREDLKHVEYEVTILESGHVIMNPLVRVFPDRYRRKESDKVDIISFILTFMVCARDFVPGQYIYKNSTNGKRRKWIKKEN